MPLLPSNIIAEENPWLRNARTTPGAVTHPAGEAASSLTYGTLRPEAACFLHLRASRRHRGRASLNACQYVGHPST